MALLLLLAVPPVAARVPSANADLSSLSIQGTDVAGFSPDTTTYTVNVPGSKARVTVAAITTDPANGSDYRAGETIKATVTFSEAVTVTGTPQLPLRIGDNMRDADYVAGDSSDTVLSFSYPVTADDLDEDGISIDAFVLKLNGGSIKRKDTTVDAALTHTRVAAAGGQRVSRPARAQTTLVSNTGQSQFATDAASYDRTQGFTTGQNPGGYNLDTVEIVSVDPQGNDATVSVCTVISAHLPAHYPTSTCTALTPPDSFAAGTLLFTAPAGTILTPSTPYVVVIGSPGGEKLEMSMTDSDDEDDHGEDDWTIAGVYHFELVEGLWINFQDVSLRIAVTGSASTGDQYALFFSDNTLTRSIAENTAANQNVGAAIPAATDADGDSLTYTMEGVDAASFTFEASTRQIQTSAALDYEAKSSYSVTVTASDGTASATIDVTITVTDEDEPPEPPAPPTLTATSGSTTSLDVSWTAPANTGKPPITSYDLRYRLGDSGSWTDGPQNVTGTTAAISALTAATEYQVQVRASNAEGDSGWSAAGTGSTNVPVNNAPEFPSAMATRTVPENLASGQDVGTAIPAATDADAGDTLTYTMEGADAASFTFEASTRQIQASAARDHETTSSYSVTVKADDGNGGTDTIAVTITVTDIDEQPDKPAKPTVTATVGSTTSLDVSWTEPGLNGGPEITGYQLQYQSRASATDAWSGVADWTHTGTATMTTITGLTADTEYQVRVQALNGERPSDWSDSSDAVRTNANNAPEFPSTTATRTVPENLPSGQNVGAAIPAATDADGDSLTYTMEGADAASFTFEASTRQIQASAALDHETTSSYSVTVKADDGNGGTDTIAVTITVTDIDEQPDKPAKPTVTATVGSTTSLDVSWTEPGLNGGPEITGYQLQYQSRASATDAWSGVADWTHTGTATMTTITGLTADTEYQVQVRALNGERPSDWSDSSDAVRTNANNAPEFPSTTATRTVPENTAVNQNVGAAIPAATDADGDSLTYTMEGVDAASFRFEASTRQIQTSAALDYEAKPSYSVTIRVSDGTASATIDVTITVTDEDEPPAAPAAPTVSATSGSTTSLDVSWTEPANDGKPPIASYDLRYRVGSSGSWTDGSQDVTGTTAAISALTAATEYQVQVRATNAEGDSGWSAAGTGSTNTPANNAPAFSLATATRSIAENTAANQNVGAAIPAATDADAGDTLTYSMEGADAASFRFEASTRQIQTSAALDYEAKSSYSVTVTASDGTATATIDVTITVTDVEEPPEPPTLTATSGSTTSLDVSWTAPANTGKPAITSYDLRYRVGDSGSWTDGPQNVTGTTVAISGLTAATEYQVQVRASNAEGDSGWSAASTGSTNTPANNAPEFPSATTTREVPENLASGQDVGAVLTATDSDMDTLTYTLEGTDAASFDIVSTSGQIRTKAGVTYDHETTSSYSVTVKADDGNGGTDTIAVTITVTDIDEQPDKPAKPTVTATVGSTTSLDVSWTEPGLNGGPEITGYQLQYQSRASATDAWSGVADWTHTGTATMTTITGLTADTEYQVQVRALNGERPSDWSDSSDAVRTNANNAPEFPSTTATRTVPENTAVNQNVGAAIPAATDADGDSLTYTMEGTDAASFTFEASTRQIQTSAALDYEAKPSYSVTIRVSDGTASATIDVTITVTDEDEPPEPPAPPTLTATSGSTTSLDVSWTAPANEGKPPITSYDLRYRVGSSGSWTDGPQDEMGTASAITGLAVDAEHQVQVRATNAEGDSGWSAAGTGSTGSTSVPTVYVSFEQSTYTVDEGSSVTVTVELSADPERSVMISISRTNQDGADEDDYFLPASVTFDSGETSQTISFNASVDTVDEDGESVTLGFDKLPPGVSAGTPNVATVSITDVPAVDEDATLSSLSLSGITTMQAFSPHTYQYSASVPSFVSSTRVTATPNDPGASVKIKVIAGGSLNADGTTVTLAEGGNIIRARVTAPDGTDLIYSVIVYRAAAPGSASDATLRLLILSGIALHPPFDSDTTTYTASVVNGVSSTTVYAPPSDNNATRVVKHNGALDNDGTVALELGANTITVVVTAQDEITTETYTVTVTRDTGGFQPSSDATLRSLSLSGNTLTPTFASGTYAYAASVGNTVAEVTVTATQNDSGATIEYLDASDMTLTDADTSETGQQVALAVGDNVIKVKVTAADTTTTLTYSVRVNRPAAPNNAPVFSDSMLTRTVPENTGANQNVGAVIPAARDADGDSLTYTMEGADADAFTFEASARRIKTKTGVTYDHEANSSYAVSIRVSDGAASGTIDVTITVTDEDEPPAAPGAPTVSATSGSTTSLNVSWAEPANEGKPAITSYDLRYRVGSSGSWTDGPQNVTGTTAAISGLTADTEHQVQVRATNAEGDSGWSAAGTGSTSALENNAPVFSDATLTRTVPENSAANQDVGAVIPAARDADGDSLTYTMEGTDAASFTFEASTRQIQTSAALDYEAKPSYSVTIRVSDGTASATIDVTITVTDEDEPPEPPAPPTLTATSGSTTSLDVSWTAPANEGKPPITSYDLRYRVGSSGSWTDGPQDEMGTASAITGLAVDTEHQVQVRATNAEGDSGWSAAGTGSTGSTSVPTVYVSFEQSTYTVDEGSSVTVTVELSADPERSVMISISRTNQDGADEDDYFLPASVTFDSGETSQTISFNASVDTVDEDGESVTLGFDKLPPGVSAGTPNVATVSITDVPAVDEDAPQNLSAQARDERVVLTWDAPAGQTISAYAYRYSDGGYIWGKWKPILGSVTTVEVDGLTNDIEYTFEVRAYSNEVSPASQVTATPNAGNNAGNNDPEFPSTTATRDVPENSAADTNVGAAVTADDADSDTLTYTLEGTDASSFDIDSGTGQIKTVSSGTYDYEAKSSYSVTVTASDGTASATIDVTITVTDEDEPPAAPDAPTVSATAGSTTSLDVSWTAPANEGKPPITSYDLRYRVGSSGSWTDGPQNVTGTTAAISALAAGTEYQVQVRASNAEGDSGWSAAGTGSTSAPGNNAPVFSDATLTRTVPENTAANQNVGAAIPAATDDDGDTLTYTMEGTDATSFALNASTRQITTITGVTYDHEAKSSYAVTIRVSDGAARGAGRADGVGHRGLDDESGRELDGTGE